MTSRCVHCSTPTGDAEVFFCSRCSAQISRRLRAIAGHVRDLENVVVTRQTSHRGERIMVRTSQEFPLVYDVPASAAAAALHTAIRGLLQYAQPGSLRYLGPDESEHMARWLAEHTWALAMHHQAERIYAEVAGLHRAAVAAVDSPAVRVLLGPCAACGGDVRAEETASSVVCDGCGVVLDVAEFKVSVRNRMRGGLATLPELEVFFRGQVRKNLLQVWRNRGRITPVLTGFEGDEPLYRIGIVMDLVAASKRRL